MKKFLTILMTIGCIAGVCGCVFLFLQKEKLISDREALLSQNSQLQQSIDAIGPFTTVYTVKTKVKPGDEVLRDNIVELSVPVSNTSINTVTTIDDICGSSISELNKYYYKVTVEPNTTITKDLVMQDFMESPVYERDLVLPFKPIGLKVGDYIDVRVTLPGGEEMRALTHKRVYMIFDNVIKLKLSEGELSVYSTMLVDQQHFSAYGLKVYATKYIEPGLSLGKEPLPMYPISNYSATLMNRDPEVLNKTDYINTELRTYIEQLLLLYADAEEGTVFPGLPTTSHLSGESSALNSAQDLYIDTYYGEDGEPINPTTDISGTGGDGNLDGYETPRVDAPIADLNSGSEKLENTLGDLSDLNSNTSDTVKPVEPTQAPVIDTTKETIGNVDSEGNRSNIGDQDKQDSKTSGSIFSDADDID